jgi:hypothetical protein
MRFLMFLRMEACEACVKLSRVAFAIVLDAIIAALVVLIATGLAFLIGKLPSGAHPEDLETVHRVITIVTILVYFGWGVWDSIKSVIKPTIPPCGIKPTIPPC